MRRDDIKASVAAKIAAILAEARNDPKRLPKQIAYDLKLTENYVRRVLRANGLGRRRSHKRVGEADPVELAPDGVEPVSGVPDKNA